LLSFPSFSNTFSASWQFIFDLDSFYGIIFDPSNQYSHLNSITLQTVHQQLCVLIAKCFVFLEEKCRRKFSKKNSRKISTNDERNFFVHCSEQASVITSFIALFLASFLVTFLASFLASILTTFLA
jgi:hypothetical protein